MIDPELKLLELVRRALSEVSQVDGQHCVAKLRAKDLVGSRHIIKRKHVIVRVSSFEVLRIAVSAVRVARQGEGLLSSHSHFLDALWELAGVNY